ncbi:lysoplasmalogenase-like [Bradysia coprophila]|uniref:lysoplasmalogenase-like n=1 Tax=Bradysia coprophila TaxID=38358 RepID=UPI00187D9434|nr:lysoplasmalogenase-like [Bradysia coprophila]
MALNTILLSIPFIASIGLYFTLLIPEHIPSLWSTVVKCLPILSLALFTRLHEGFVDETRINRKIFTGLLFSCVGDACLIWPEYFLYGVVAFGVAQILFIRAAGIEPLNLKLGLVFIPYANIVLYLIRAGVMEQPIVLAAAVFLYSPILLGRVWLACSKFLRHPGNSTNALESIAALSFMVSDSYLSLNRFYSVLPYHQEIVMFTYYLAQAAVTFTVLNESKRGNKKSKIK